MGSGVSRARAKSLITRAPSTCEPSPSACPPAPSGSSDAVVVEPKLDTAIDARIIQTLRELNLARRQADTKVKSINFERIVLRFSMAHVVFDTLHEIYDQFADGEKGLDFDGLRAALQALGAEMNEKDMREIFYESDMVRDNRLNYNEFVISLAISHLLGLIHNFENLSQSVVQPLHDSTTSAGRGAEAADVDIKTMNTARSEDGARSADNLTAMICKTLELIVTAYLLFDDDASGTIQTNEVYNVMQQHEPSRRRSLERKSSGLTTKVIRAERIKELDLNHDGTITFQEFVLTFQKWVGVED